MKVTLNPLLNEVEELFIQVNSSNPHADIVVFRRGEVIEIDETNYSKESLFSKTNERSIQKTNENINKLKDLGVDYKASGCAVCNKVTFNALMEVEE